MSRVHNALRRLAGGLLKIAGESAEEIIVSQVNQRLPRARSLYDLQARQEKITMSSPITVSPASIDVTPESWPYGSLPGGSPASAPASEYEKILNWMQREGMPSFDSVVYSLRSSENPGAIAILVGTVAMTKGSVVWPADARNFLFDSAAMRVDVAKYLFGTDVPHRTYSPAPAPNAPIQYVGQMLTSPEYQFLGTVRQLVPDVQLPEVGSIKPGPDGNYKLVKVATFGAGSMFGGAGGAGSDRLLWVKV